MMWAKQNQGRLYKHRLSLLHAITRGSLRQMATPVSGSHQTLYISLRTFSSEILCLYESVSSDRLHAPPEKEAGVIHLRTSSASPEKVLDK